MKKGLLFVFILVLPLASMLIAPVTSLADHDDIELTYTISPELVGIHGAEVQILISVTNVGTTPVTGLDVGVTTLAGFSQRWIDTINPGMSRSLSYFVPFATEDLNADKLLTVAIENDGDGDFSDGTQVRTFQVEGTSRVFNKDWFILPDSDSFYVGDTVHITHHFTNTFEANAATTVSSRCYLAQDGGMVCNNTPIDHGIVMPGETIENTFSYTLTEDDVGHVTAAYQLLYTMMGEDYDARNWTVEFDVIDPTPEISFTAHLRAAPTEIDAGDEVTFTIEIENTGVDGIDTFDIFNEEAGLDASLEGLGAGGSGSTSLTAVITETTDVSYVVQAIAGAASDMVETNVIRITVREPEESEEPVADPSESEEPESSEEPDDDTAESTEEAETPPAESAPTTPSPVELSGEEEASSAESDESASINDASAVIQPRKSSTVVLYVIIGALGLLVVAAAIVIPILLSKKKKDDKSKDKKKPDRSDSF